MVLCCQGINQVGVEYLIALPVQQWLTRLPEAGSTAIRLAAVSTLSTVTVVALFGSASEFGRDGDKGI